MTKRPREDSVSSLCEQFSASSPSDGLLPSPPETERAHTPKFVHLDEPSNAESVIRCDLPPHKSLVFSSYEDYDLHYEKEHVNRCIVCYKNFPSSRYLDLHHAENHDPINEARKAKGEKTYACLVEGCVKVCWTWQKRKLHMIDKHAFPKNYDFWIVNYGLDHRQSMLRPERRPNKPGLRKSRKGETKASNLQGGSEPSSQSNVGFSENVGFSQSELQKPADSDVPMNDIADAMSALKFVPRSVQLSRGAGRDVFAQQ